MENNQLILILCLCFAHVIGIRFEFSEKIISYFKSRNVAVLHLFVCSEKDNIHLRKTEGFSSFLAVLFHDREIQWDMIKRENSGWFVDSTCYFNRNLLRSIPEGMLGGGYFWLIRSELDEIEVALNQMELGLSTDLVVAEDNGTYYDVYKLTSQSELKIEMFKRLHLPSKRSRYNLEKKPLRGALVLNSIKLRNQTFGLILDKYYYYSPNEKLNRLSYAYSTYLSTMYNFKLDVLISETYGYKSNNGTYNGLIRDLILKKADYGINAIAFTNERLGIIDYSINIDSVTFIFIFVEENGFGGYTALAQPFSSNVWAGLLIVTSVSILVTLVVQLSKNPLSVFVDSCIHIIRILSSQGFANEIPWHNTKFLSSVLLLFYMMITIFYHTSIMNGLLSPSPIKIKTVQDVLDKREIGLANISYLTPPFFHPLVLKKLNETSKKIYEIAAGIKKLQKDKTFSLIGDGKSCHEVMEQYLTDFENCNTRELPMSSKIEAGIPFIKNSHYKEMILQGQLLLIESGIAHREKKYWYTPAPKCLLKNAFFPVSIESVLIGLIIYSIGFILSIITFKAEIIIRKNTSNM